MKGVRKEGYVGGDWKKGKRKGESEVERKEETHKAYS